MTLKDFKLILLLFLFSLPVIGQNKLSGYITNGTDNTVINNVQVFEKSAGLLTTSDAKGYYEFSSEKAKLTLIFYI
jgi:Fe(3+) dicitrate transport protein